MARYSLREGFADVDSGLAAAPFAAVIATPAHTHVPIAKKLVEAGVHLLIEKPLSTSLQGVKELCSRILEMQLTAAIAYVYRAHPLLGKLRNDVLGGAVGNVVQVVVTAGQHFPTYRPAYREIYYTDHRTGGGAIQDALTHLVNAVEWVVGPVSRLVADAEHKVLPGVQVEDTVHLLARHGEVMATYALNQHQAPNETTISVMGTRGTARLELHHQKYQRFEMPEKVCEEMQLPPQERDAMFVMQAHAFLDCLESGVPVPCSLDDGLQTLRVNLAALESAKSGKWIDIIRNDDA